jgi:transposase
MKGTRLVIQNIPELQVRLQQEVDAKLRLKLAFLSCFAEVSSDLEALSQAFGIGTSTGYWWIRNWNQSGYAGLQEKDGGGGRPPRLDSVDLIYLASLLKERPYWITAEVLELIKTTFGIEYSSAQVVRILRKRLHMHFSKPFPHDYRRPPAAEAILKERLGAVFNRLKSQAIENQEVALGFLDESSPQNRANTVRVWSFEASPEAVKNTDHFKSNTIGFYAIQGHSVQAFLDNSREDSILDFLKQVKAAHPGYKAIIVVLDNYRSHHSAKVAAAAEEMNIHLVFLPPYSPDLNPEEYLWKSIKRVMSKGLIPNLEEMKATIKSAWDELSQNLGFAKAWIAEFLTEENYYSELCA